MGLRLRESSRISSLRQTVLRRNRSLRTSKRARNKNLNGHFRTDFSSSDLPNVRNCKVILDSNMVAPISKSILEKTSKKKYIPCDALKSKRHEVKSNVKAMENHCINPDKISCSVENEEITRSQKLASANFSSDISCYNEEPQDESRLDIQQLESKSIERSREAADISSQGTDKIVRIRGNSSIRIGLQKRQKYLKMLSKRNCHNLYKQKISAPEDFLREKHEIPTMMQNGNEDKKYLITNREGDLINVSLPGTSKGSNQSGTSSNNALPVILRRNEIGRISDTDDDEDICHLRKTKGKNVIKEVVDVIDGIAFVAFENEYDMVQFTRSASEECYSKSEIIDSDFELIEAIAPRKTKDIKKIKGWQRKKFTVSLNPVSDILDIESSGTNDSCTDNIIFEHNYIRQPLNSLGIHNAINNDQRRDDDKSPDKSKISVEKEEKVASICEHLDDEENMNDSKQSNEKRFFGFNDSAVQTKSLFDNSVDYDKIMGCLADKHTNTQNQICSYADAVCDENVQVEKKKFTRKRETTLRITKGIQVNLSEPSNVNYGSIIKQGDVLKSPTYTWHKSANMNLFVDHDRAVFAVTALVTSPPKNTHAESDQCKVTKTRLGYQLRERCVTDNRRRSLRSFQNHIKKSEDSDFTSKNVSETSSSFRMPLKQSSSSSHKSANESNSPNLCATSSHISGNVSASVGGSSSVSIDETSVSLNVYKSDVSSASYTSPSANHNSCLAEVDKSSDPSLIDPVETKKLFVSKISSSFVTESDLTSEFSTRKMKNDGISMKISENSIEDKMKLNSSITINLSRVTGTESMEKCFHNSGKVNLNVIQNSDEPVFDKKKFEEELSLEHENLKNFLKPKPRCQHNSSSENTATDSLSVDTTKSKTIRNNMSNSSPPRSNNVEVFKSTSPKSPALARKKLIRELSKLNANFVSVDESPSKKISEKCNEEFCRLGCVCQSLRTEKRGTEHCGRIECMFSCTCSPKSNFSRSPTQVIGNDTVSRLQEESSRHMAKVEKEFHNTVVEAAGELVLPGRQQRERRIPKRFLDEDMIPETLIPKSSKPCNSSKINLDSVYNSKKNEAKSHIQKLVKSFSLVIHKAVLTGIKIRCMNHFITNCPCVNKRPRNVAVKSTASRNKLFLPKKNMNFLNLETSRLSSKLNTKILKSNARKHSESSSLEKFFNRDMNLDVELRNERNDNVSFKDSYFTKHSNADISCEKTITSDVKTNAVSISQDDMIKANNISKETTANIETDAEKVSQHDVSNANIIRETSDNKINAGKVPQYVVDEGNESAAASTSTEITENDVTEVLPDAFHSTSPSVAKDESSDHCARTAGFKWWQFCYNSGLPHEENIPDNSYPNNTVSESQNVLIFQEETSQLCRIVEVKSLNPSSYSPDSHTVEEVNFNQTNILPKKYFSSYDSFYSCINSNQITCKDLDLMCSKSLVPLPVNAVKIMKWVDLDNLWKSHSAHLWKRQRLGSGEKVYVTDKDAHPDAAAVNFRDLEKKENLNGIFSYLKKTAKHELDQVNGCCILIRKSGFWEIAGHLTLNEDKHAGIHDLTRETDFQNGSSKTSSSISLPNCVPAVQIKRMLNDKKSKRKMKIAINRTTEQRSALKNLDCDLSLTPGTKVYLSGPSSVMMLNKSETLIPDQISVEMQTSLHDVPLIESDKTKDSSRFSPKIKCITTLADDFEEMSYEVDRKKKSSTSSKDFVQKSDDMIQIISKPPKHAIITEKEKNPAFSLEKDINTSQNNNLKSVGKVIATDEVIEKGRYRRIFLNPEIMAQKSNVSSNKDDVLKIVDNHDVLSVGISDKQNIKDITCAVNDDELSKNRNTVQNRREESLLQSSSIEKSTEKCSITSDSRILPETSSVLILNLNKLRKSKIVKNPIEPVTIRVTDLKTLTQGLSETKKLGNVSDKKGLPTRRSTNKDILLKTVSLATTDFEVANESKVPKNTSLVSHGTSDNTSVRQNKTTGRSIDILLSPALQRKENPSNSLDKSGSEITEKQMVPLASSLSVQSGYEEQLKNQGHTIIPVEVSNPKFDKVLEKLKVTEVNCQSKKKLPDKDPRHVESEENHLVTTTISFTTPEVQVEKGVTFPLSVPFPTLSEKKLDPGILNRIEASPSSEAESSSSASRSIITIDTPSSALSDSIVNEVQPGSKESNVIWYRLYLNHEFDRVTVTGTGFSTSEKKLFSAVKLANYSKKTVRLAFDKNANSQEPLQFKKGIYAVPSGEDMYVRIGPFKQYEETGVVTLKKYGKVYKPTPSLLILDETYSNSKDIGNEEDGVTSERETRNLEEKRKKYQECCDDELETVVIESSVPPADRTQRHIQEDIESLKYPSLEEENCLSSTADSDLNVWRNNKATIDPSTVIFNSLCSDEMDKSVSLSENETIKSSKTVGSMNGNGVSEKNIVKINSDSKILSDADSCGRLKAVIDDSDHTEVNALSYDLENEEKRGVEDEKDPLAPDDCDITRRDGEDSCHIIGEVFGQCDDTGYSVEEIDTKFMLKKKLNVTEEIKYDDPSVPVVESSESQELTFRIEDVRGNWSDFTNLPSSSSFVEDPIVPSQNQGFSATHQPLQNTEDAPLKAKHSTVKTISFGGISVNLIQEEGKNKARKVKAVRSNAKSPVLSKKRCTLTNSERQDFTERRNEGLKDVPGQILSEEDLSENIDGNDKGQDSVSGFIFPDIRNLAPIPAVKGDISTNPGSAMIAIEDPANPGSNIKFPNIDCVDAYVDCYLRNQVTFFPSDMLIKWKFLKGTQGFFPGMTDVKNVSDEMFITPNGIYKFKDYNTIEDLRNIGLDLREKLRFFEIKKKRTTEEARHQLASLLLPQPLLKITDMGKTISKALEEIKMQKELDSALCQELRHQTLRRKKLEEKYRILLQAQGLPYSEYRPTVEGASSSVNITTDSNEDFRKRKSLGKNRKRKFNVFRAYKKPGGNEVVRTIRSSSNGSSSSKSYNEVISLPDKPIKTKYSTKKGGESTGSGEPSVLSFPSVVLNAATPEQNSNVTSNGKHVYKAISISPDSVRNFISDTNIEPQGSCSTANASQSSLKESDLQKDQDQNSSVEKHINALLWRESFSKVVVDQEKTPKNAISHSSKEKDLRHKKNISTKNVAGTKKKNSSSNLHETLSGWSDNSSDLPKDSLN